MSFSNAAFSPPRKHAEAGRRVLAAEAQGVADLIERVGAEFDAAVEDILVSSGRVIVCGMGKSGLVGRKIAATLASTGTPSFFLHPAEALHGDLGMATDADYFLGISNSGETQELVALLPFLLDNGNRILAMTGNPTSTLASHSTFHLDVSVAEEACSLNLAPTTSTTAALAMGDALAVALMEARGFVSENFARLHPGGSIGRRLLDQVSDVMITKKLPWTTASDGILEVIRQITKSQLGIALVSTPNGPAIITDGDIRRAVQDHDDAFFSLVAADIMTTTPTMVAPTTRMEDALALMASRQISSLLVGVGDDVLGVVTSQPAPRG
ncbi:KpsF/GutQ family sugar-phosphate isomerase [Paeniglutamicibacter sulfureus]|uniref:KpsF/GutQ family sugar-phosphate isomerase n=1 Tax=Paeniglutamicibacter sulfureus TaxID=43666 RepID=UPI002665E5D7|nr:KpsF/GutQ family sugar-phosphate isomerase [Paeniglutamicibacter sulfureus]MDO2935980.1 KpsF/GutQ family sugar-phosphate isomerase [Paeniglutamicibacter sulfureus]